MRYRSLHSAEALKRMTSYQIGIIEGRWKNFLPPIQGGTFRAEVDEKNISDLEDSEEAASSRSTTPPESPLFEPVVTRRQRGSQNTSDLSEVSSLSSISSLEDIEEDVGKRKSSRLDGYTQKSINYDLAKYPSLDPQTQDDIIRRYRLLHDRIRAEGLYQCNYISYLKEVCRYAILFGMCLLSIQRGWYGTGGLFLGFFWHQLVFTAHDAGHMGITHSFTVDTLIGIIIADFLGGLSMGWWKRNHNVHHVVTNSPEHDPDIEHMPFLAVSHRFFQSLRSTYYDRIMAYDCMAKLIVRYQHYLYYPILTFGRFNLYRLSWEYLLFGLGPKKGPAWWHRWVELAGQIFFWSWFGYGIVYKSIPSMGGRIMFIMVSHMITAVLHVQITLSHFAMSTADLGVDESFPQKMLRTTMDVECPEWLDFFHGGLQFQAIHHLYPRLPRHNLRRTQKLVQQFCDESGIPYALYGFVDGNKEVIGRLREVAHQAAILAQCQRSIMG
jgi:delta8-fatty-acid desaturase